MTVGGGEGWGGVTRSGFGTRWQILAANLVSSMELDGHRVTHNGWPYRISYS